jgi:hypothetical protein
VANIVSGSRYSREGNFTVATFDNLSDPGPLQSFFGRLTLVHSGNFRTRPDDSDSFTYPLVLDRRYVRPGTVFYSPDGHVGMVAEVRKDGTIKLLDAHPDQSITRILLSPKLQVRASNGSGGFRGFRWAVGRGERAEWIDHNERLPGFSLEQSAFADFHAEVRKRMRGGRIDPLATFERYIREDAYQEALDRAAAVELGWQAARERTIAIPENIYEAEGDWENFSTPARDIRLRLSFLGVAEEARRYVQLMREQPKSMRVAVESPEALGRKLLEIKERLFEDLAVPYRMSSGEEISITLAEIERRLFRLSFDPNHPPELRWGSKNVDPVFLASYEWQQSWRNRLTKKGGAMSPDDADNPAEIPPHDLSAMIRRAIHDVAPSQVAAGGN